ERCGPGSMPLRSNDGGMSDGHGNAAFGRDRGTGSGRGTRRRARRRQRDAVLGGAGRLPRPVRLQGFRRVHRLGGRGARPRRPTPNSVADVQEIVRIANEFRVPLWTFGQGRNFTYGGPAPRVRDSIQVSFRRMNRVLEVDDELAYAVVEPGVSFFDLFHHLQDG